MGGACSTSGERARIFVVAFVLLLRSSSVAALDARLGWRPAGGAVGYHIQQQIDALGWQVVDTVAAPTPDADGVIRHLVPGIPVGSVVSFTVSAYDAAGRESPPSNALSVFVTPTPLPIATSTPTATAPSPTIAPATSTATATRPPPSNTASASQTPTATPTATRARRIRGRVAYYAGNQPIAAALVTLDGPTSLQATATDAQGAFDVDGSSGLTWKLAVDPISAEAGPAVSALDAAYVLQTIAGTRTLDDRQRMACDVTGNGSLTALDAALLLQQAVGLIDQPPVTSRCHGQWLVVPAPAAAPGQQVIPPLFDAQRCASGAIAYDPLTGPLDAQDFVAVLFGDCTGNWRPAGSGAFQQRNERAAVYLRQPYERWSGHWVVPVAARSDSPFSALDVRLEYDPRLVAIDDARNAAATRGSAVAARADASGRFAIALAAAEPLTVDDATVARILVSADDVPVLRILDARLDEQPVGPPR